MTDENEAEVVTVAFNVPAAFAETMTRSAGSFYLDVFGNVRDSATTEKIGVWSRTDLVRFDWNVTRNPYAPITPSQTAHEEARA
jgi:hypothetical protein